jgi:hypothetical protein
MPFMCLEFLEVPEGRSLVLIQIDEEIEMNRLSFISTNAASE